VRRDRGEVRGACGALCRHLGEMRGSLPQMRGGVVEGPAR
jgi:hypothetical protein